MNILCALIEYDSLVTATVNLKLFRIKYSKIFRITHTI